MLKIQVVSQSGRALAKPVEVCLDENGGTMGRLATNQVVLPDPERHVSRIHARIVHRPGGYFILHQGSNPILLNGATLRIGDQAPLNDGDELAVCTYRLRVAVPPSASGATDASIPPNATSSAAMKSSEEIESRLDVTSILASSPQAALQLQPAPAASMPNPELSRELPPPSGAVDFALETPPQAANVIGTAAEAELFLSWETDMDLYRMAPPRSFGAADLVNRVPAGSVVQGRHEPADLVRPAMVGQVGTGTGAAVDVGVARAEADRGARANRDVKSDREDGTNVAGTSMRAAIAEALQRFSPEHLEQRLKHRTMLDSVLSINRKAKLWDLFTHMYGEIAQEVQEDVHGVLAKESLKLCAGKASLRNGKEEIGS